MGQSVRAAVLDAVGRDFEIREVRLDEPQPREVVVRIVAAGVCGTDVHVRSGGVPFPLPGIVGHEGAGIVEAVGSGVTSVVPGDKVILTFTSCGTCRNCMLAHPAYCSSFLTLNLFGGARADGSATVYEQDRPLHAHFFAQSSFATHVLADERGVAKVPADSDLSALAPLGCGVQTGAGAVFNVLRPEPGTTLVVFGAGAVGLSAVMAANLSPVARIVVVDVVPERLALARELGATDVIDASDGDLDQLLADVIGPDGADYAIDASGVAAVVQTALAILRPLGTLASIGAPPPGTTIPADVNYMLNGRRYIGITEGDSVPQVFLPALVEMVRQGRMPVDKLIQRFPFDDINRAAEGIVDGSVVKPVLVFPEEA